MGPVILVAFVCVCMHDFIFMHYTVCVCACMIFYEIYCVCVSCIMFTKTGVTVFNCGLIKPAFIY